ncbi:MAG: glycosyltransferase [Cytophagales bacterium]|nr:glycosyltransferase [Cytophagales bacterium]
MNSFENVLNPGSCIVFLCSKLEINRERLGYFNSLSKYIKVYCLEPQRGENIEQLISRLPKGIIPILILHPDASPYLPYGIENSKIPTACFQIDTYSNTSIRVKQALLFNIVFVFHPGFDSTYRSNGHQCVQLLPHAVDKELYSPNLFGERIYEIGWVGRLNGKEYSFRRKILNFLSTKYVMNDINKIYDLKELASIYEKSKIVVNISRDDYLIDANLRCFEVMLSGALLITPFPSELNQLGFVDGEHYVSFKNLEDLNKKVSFYLKNDSVREMIANSGRVLVATEHTYDNRAVKILNVIREKKFDPISSQFDNGTINKLYFLYFVKKHLFSDAFVYLRKIRDNSFFQSLVFSLVMIRSFLGRLLFILR